MIVNMNDAPVMKGLAEKVSGNLVKQNVDKAVAFDPTILMVIFQIIQMAMEGLKNCNFLPPTPNPANKDAKLRATELVNNPNWMHKFLLKRYITKSGVDARLQGKVYQAMLSTGKELKNSDLTGAYEELNFDMI